MHENNTGNDFGHISALADRLRGEIAKAVVGQREVVDQLLAAILSGGHVLLEGVPGVAKTLVARTLAHSVSADFARVQFTPDLMPSDVTGTNVFNPTKATFELRRGPVFTGILLADEINRTPPKTQAALLEAMQEKRVTIDGEEHSLGEIFTVIATQNPIEFEGTYPLPEAQLDRFMFKVVVPYPAMDTELGVLKKYNSGFDSMKLGDAGVAQCATVDEILAARKSLEGVVCDDSIIDYIARLVRRTRDDRNLVLGASPRASIFLMLGSKALAALCGRGFVIPDDVKYLAKPILRHRLILRPEAEIEGLTSDRIIDGLLAEIEVPRS